MNRERDQGKSTLKHINKGRYIRDGIKVVFLTILLMIVGGVLLGYLGSRMFNIGNESVTARNQDTVQIQNDPYKYFFPVDDITEPYLAENDASPVLTGTNYIDQGGWFELPIYGATGWAAVRLPVRSEPHTNAIVLITLEPGYGFTILTVDGNWWYVKVNQSLSGWLEHRGAFINLPDIIPSIVYMNTNASASVMRSRGFDIPDITGAQLYSAKTFNPRLGRDEYIMPAMYPLARSLFATQQSALESGNTIVMYEAFRPAATQRAIVQGMTALIAQNSEVREAITSPPWSLGWFISTGVSHHQRGAAIDISLARVINYEYRQTGDFIYKHILEYRLRIMPTHMHELSPWSAILDSPRTITETEFRAGNITMSEYVTVGVLELHELLAPEGFTPLASEWWHFNHPASIAAANTMGIRGDFFIDTVYSWSPALPEDYE